MHILPVSALFRPMQSCCTGAEQGAGTEEGRQVSVPQAPKLACAPPLTHSRPDLPVPPSEEARGVRWLEGHATRDPAPAPLLLAATLALPVAVSPQLAVAETAWVLAASRGSSHRVNTLGDDLSCTQLALSRPMASVPSRAARVPPSLGR